MNRLLRRALAAILCLTAVRASAELAGGPEELSAGGGAVFAAAVSGGLQETSEISPSSWLRLRAFRQAPKPIVVPLPSLLDNVRRTSTKFLSGATTVRIFGDQSDNAAGASPGDWFVGFAVDGAEAQYLPAMKMVQVLGMGSSARFSAAGNEFEAHVGANLIHKLKSRLVVEDANGDKVGEWTARQISEAIYAAGYPIQIGGREYRVHYFRNFNENSSGQFGGYNGRRTISVMYRDGDGFAAFSWYLGEIPRDRPSYSTPSVSDADGHKVPGTLRLGVQIDAAGQLLIYPPY